MIGLDIDTMDFRRTILSLHRGFLLFRRSGLGF